MPLSATCHCGQVRVTLPAAPVDVVSCNCSLCLKLGTLWCYYPDAEVVVAGETVAYVWNDRVIGINHCPTCGCVTHWKTLGEDFGRMGVNARLIDGFDISSVETRLIDRASA